MFVNQRGNSMRIRIERVPRVNTCIKDCDYYLLCQTIDGDSFYIEADTRPGCVSAAAWRWAHLNKAKQIHISYKGMVHTDDFSIGFTPEYE